MRLLWRCEDWSHFLESDCRKGIRLRFDNGVDPEVVRACKEFVQWLRSQYEFPMRVPIYFKNREYLIACSGEKCSATFFGPYDKRIEPYIRISVGDYKSMMESWGKSNALGAIIHSIAHELSHYFQWLKDIDFCDPKGERQARYYANAIIDDYKLVREAP